MVKNVLGTEPRLSLNRFEKISTEIFANSELGSKAIAREIADLIISKQKELNLVYWVWLQVPLLRKYMPN